jgi:hypothetical protein
LVRKREHRKPTQETYLSGTARDVLNQYGSYGGRYSSTSIMNLYSDFGSWYSTYSACNLYASDPPIVTDGEGGYYGKLTLNKYATDAITNTTIVVWLSGVCSSR